MLRNEMEKQDRGIFSLQDENVTGCNDPEAEDLDVDHFYNMSAVGTVSELERILPEGEEFDDILAEMMEIDPETQKEIDWMDDESSFSLNKILVPEELFLDKTYTGPVYGFYRQETGYHVIFGWEGHMVPEEIGACCIGYITTEEDSREIPAISDPTLSKNGFCVIGRRTKEGLSFQSAKYNASEDAFEVVDELETEVYTMLKKLFSRNSGLIETDWMSDVCAVISGCGSVGSLVALQLARSGVGRFILIDEDCMEIHNVCRHQCGLREIGRRKVDAVRERILCINPRAEVICFRRKFQNVPVQLLNRDWLDPERTIFIGTCDNRVGNAYVCDTAYEFGIPFAALGFNARAWGGEIFTCLPEKKDICYRCTFKKQIDESIAEERRNHDYMDASDAGKVKFEPGLDVDIEFGVSLFDKVILDIINRHNEEYLPRIWHKLGQFTMFSGTDQIPEAFWKKQLKGPVSIKRIGLRPDLRRCEHCISNEKDLPQDPLFPAALEIND